MNELYNEAMRALGDAVHALEGCVPAPQLTQLPACEAYRFQEKSIQQAILQKSARLVSTLNATRILMEKGFVQEQATLQRVLDELEEDVTFLSYALIHERETDLHREYLSSFYQEEFDAESAIDSTQKRPMVSRKKIRAYLVGLDTFLDDPSRAIETSRTIHKAYSGYVHAASPHIMEMYMGFPPRFHVSGVYGTLLHQDHIWDFLNYVHRGVIAVSFAAGALENKELFRNLCQLSKKTENALSMRKET